MGGVSMEWKEVIATDYCYKVADGTHDSPKRQNKGRFLITSKHIKGPSIDFDNAYYISEDDYQKIIKRSKIDKWDVIVSMIGEYCGFCYLEDSDFTDYAVKNVGILKVGERIKSLWLYYYLNSPDGRNQLKNTRAGSSQPYISLGSLRNLLIPEPPRDVMERTVSILSSLDRKIELNNKINADLEEMAQAIFKNWFVDFEPFKDGKFVDSELGMIPEGWKVGTLGELCNFKRGKNLLTKNAIDEGVPVVAGGLEPSCYHNIANTGAPVITVSGSGANAGFMRMYHVPVWASDCSFIDISCENFYFVYCFLKVNSKLLKHAQTGAVQPHVKPSDIHDFELVIPDKESIYDFQDKVKPFFDKIALIQKENSRLSLLRDTLLPRLMSGELEVPE